MATDSERVIPGANDPVWKELPDGVATIEDGDQVVGIWVDPTAGVNLQQLNTFLGKVNLPPVREE